MKRPVRLGGMVLFTVVLGYAMLWAGLFDSLRSPSGATFPWLATFWQVTPPLATFVQDVLLHPFSSGSIYNPPLWTIHKELVGSYLVFGYIALARGLGQRWRWSLLAVLGVLTFRNLYVGFAIGIAFAEAASLQHKRSALRSTIQTPCRPQPALQGPLRWMAHACLVVGLWLGCQLHYINSSNAQRAAASWSDAMNNLFTGFGTGGCAMLGAALTFAAVWQTPRFQQALDNRLLRYMGRLSFAIYALHFLVLGAVATALHQRLFAHLGWHASALISSLVSLACLVPLASWVTRWVDGPSIRASSAIAKRLEALGSAAATRYRLRAPQANAAPQIPAIEIEHVRHVA